MFGLSSVRRRAFIRHLCLRRDISKDKEKCEGEEEEGKEQSTTRGRKTANSQGRRKGRITTRSMANNEAASVVAEEPPPPPSEPGNIYWACVLYLASLNIWLALNIIAINFT